MSTEQIPTGEPSTRLRKRRSRRRWIAIVVVAAVVLALGGTAWALLRPKRTTVGAADTTVLKYGDLVSSISATGVVSAKTSAKVYSSLAYQVQDVYVTQGQAVQAGDRLAQLDTATVDKQIASKKASMSQTAASAAASLATAQHKYDAAQAAISDGTNAGILNAQNAVTTAHANWTKATATYEAYRSGLDDGQNSQLISAQTAVDNARNSVTAASYTEQLAYDTWVAAGKPDYPAPTKTALDQAQNALKAARTAYENAQSAYDAVATTTDNTLSDYQAAADAAYDSYTAAESSLNASRTSAQTDLQLSLDSVKSAQASSRTDAAVTDLANLVRDKQSATIVSPITGVVTAVYATVGAPGQGVLFVVETPDSLKIDASVKEYDVNSVKPGMSVLITADATRDAVYNGRISSIAPASDKDAAGKTITGSDIQYGTTVDVTSSGTQLRIGMNVRLQYVVDTAEHVLAVPYDAVRKNATGTDVVLAVVPRGGASVLEEYPVTVGLASDLNIAVSGANIVEGLRVVNNPATYKAGAVVTLAS